jgi:hypothetical protein
MRSPKTHATRAAAPALITADCVHCDAAIWQTPGAAVWHSDTGRTCQRAAVPPADLDKQRAEILHDAETEIDAIKVESTGRLWLFDRGFGCHATEQNAIYYKHTGRWSFGWYTPLSDAAISRLLDVLSEFPYAYDIKGYDAYRNKQNATTTATAAAE